MIPCKLIGPAKNLMRTHAHAGWIEVDSSGGLKIVNDVVEEADKRTMLVRMSEADAVKVACDILAKVRLDRADTISPVSLDAIDTLVKLIRMSREQ